MDVRLGSGDEERQRSCERLRVDFGAPLRQTAEAIGLPIDEVTSTGSVALATKRTQLDVTTIEVGTVAAWRFKISGMRNGKPLLQFCNTWYVTSDLDQPWGFRDSGWHVVVEGDAPLDIGILFAKKDYGTISPGYNAHICVNAVPNVCNAKPGILATADMPQIVAQFA